MNELETTTERVIRRHLTAFLEQLGVEVLVADYRDDACFFTAGGIYRGRDQIRHFFTSFIASLPAGAIDDFALTNLLVSRDVGYITWSVGSDIPLGTDTFVVHDGKIASQTFAMCAATA